MKEDHFPVTHTEAEWRAILTPEQYDIMRGHGTERPGSCALLYEKRPGRLRLRGLRAAAVREQDQVRKRHRLAELQYAGRRRGRDDDRPQLRHDAHRSALLALRIASRPRISGWSAANGPALLHQWRRDKFHAGGGMTRKARIRRFAPPSPGGRRARALSRERERVGVRVRHERHDPARGARRLALRPIRPSQAAGSACSSSISARRRGPTTGRSAAISTSSSPTAASSRRRARSGCRFCKLILLTRARAPKGATMTRSGIRSGRKGR